jgi:RNA polymerase sigma-70 factor (ECF subfamily)
VQNKASALSLRTGPFAVATKSTFCIIRTVDAKQEQQLIQRCRENPAAFGDIFDIWYAPVFGYVYRRTADYDLSRDIAAETFLKAYLNISKFKWRGISVSSWIYRIATNELNQYYRKQRYQPQSLQQLLEDPGMEKLLHAQADNEKEIIEKEMKDLDTYSQVRVNLLRLDIKYQEVISLRYFEQKTNTEISSILDKNEGTVKSLLSRGLEKLRNML